MSGKTLNGIFLDHAKKYPTRTILKHKEVKGGRYVDVTGYLSLLRRLSLPC